MSLQPDNAVTGVILCGGQARRLGGVDKGLVVLQGRPLIAHVLERLGPQVDEVLINANRNLETYGTFGPRVIADDIEGFPGPLAGIRRALAEAAHALVATVPCDAPQAPADLVARLRAALLEGDAEAAVAVAASRSQPVFALYRRGVLPALDAFLASDGRKVDAWQARLKTVQVQFDQAAAFTNVNTPEDLTRAERGP